MRAGPSGDGMRLSDRQNKRRERKDFNMKSALQLCSLSTLCKEDFFAAIRCAAQVGYQGVEFAGYFGKTAAELKEILAECGLEAAGTHIGFDLAVKDLDNSIRTAKELGIQSVVVPAPVVSSDDAKGWAAFAADMNRAGEVYRKEGIIFGYHNHAHELLRRFDGKQVIDIFLDNSDPKNVCWEMDAFWVVKGEDDPIERARCCRDRMPLLHAKDIGPNGEGIEAGNGQIDFDAIADVLGDELRWVIVEQEEFQMDPCESVRISAENMNALCRRHQTKK